MNRSTTLSGRPAMSEARRQAVHGPLVSAIADDATWNIVYRGLVRCVAVVWLVAGALAVAVWGAGA